KIEMAPVAESASSAEKVAPPEEAADEAAPTREEAGAAQKAPPPARRIVDDEPESEPPRAPQGSGWAARVLPLVAAVVVIAATFWIIATGRQAPGAGLPTTIADLQAVHADVSLHGAPVRGVARASAHDTIETGDGGRARLRLDDGAQIVI